MCLGSSQPTQQNTMEGHLEKHDHRQAIATFVIIIGNRNNIATKRKMKVASIDLCTQACRFWIPSLFFLRHLGHN